MYFIELVKMKRITLIILFMLNISIFSNDFGLSVKGGMNYSFLKYDYDKEYNINYHNKNYSLGLLFTFSIALDYRLYNNLYLAVEGVSNNINIDWTIFTKFETPFYLLYKYKKIGIYSGVFWSYVYESNALNEYYLENRKDYGFLLGVQFERKNLFFDLRYEQGFNIVYDHRGGDELYDYYYNISQFSIMIGYRFF
jgi:hypothetical protein